MARANWIAREVETWLAAVDSLRRWRQEAAAGPSEATVTDLRALLEALARGQTTLPREMPARADALAQALAPKEHQSRLAAWRQRRSALLRLAVWRVLHALQVALPPGARGPAGADPMAALQDAMASTALRVPPGLSPSLDSAADAKAQQFFGGCVRDILRRLAERHAGHAVWLERVRAARYEVGSVAGAQAWSEAWTVGIAANYLNCLQAKSAGDVGRAMTLLWSEKSTRIHAADKLLLLPARERHLHLDLWTDLVQAQALDHQPERFREQAAWHRVRLKMHDLGLHEQVDGGSTALFDRGIGVDLLHLPVFADRAWLALRSLPTTAAATGAATPQTIVVDLPDLAPGQAANLRLVLRLAGAPGEEEDPPRRLEPLAPPVLNAEQQALYRRWAERGGDAPLGPGGEPARGLTYEPAHGLATATLQWSESGELGGRGEPDAPAALGTAALWEAAASPLGVPQWLDVALVVRKGGRWSVRPLDVQPRVVAGDLRCELALDDDGHDAAALRGALRDPGRAHWVGTTAGLGALVMVGVDLDGRAPARGG